MKTYYNKEVPSDHKLAFEAQAVRREDYDGCQAAHTVHTDGFMVVSDETGSENLLTGIRLEPGKWYRVTVQEIDYVPERKQVVFQVDPYGQAIMPPLPGWMNRRKDPV